MEGIIGERSIEMQGLGLVWRKTRLTEGLPMNGRDREWGKRDLLHEKVFISM